MKAKKTNYGFLIFIAIIFICIIVIFSTIDRNIIFATGDTPIATNRNPLRFVSSENPIEITPSNVRVISSSTSVDEQEVYSPNMQRMPSEHNFRIINTETRTSRSYTHVNNYVFRRTRSEFKSDPEMLCCKIFEELIEEPVEVNIRPNFLKNPKTGQNLELDCFYRKKRIAIEYNGSQHYKYQPFFHKGGNQSFLDGRQRDKLKRELCLKNDIKLICVPWTVDSGRKGKDGTWKYVKRTLEEREALLRAYIEPFLYEYLQEYELEN